MKKTLKIAALVAATIALTGCEKKAETPTAEAPKVAANAADAMSSMAMPVDAKMGKATGTVTAIDAAEGKITLDHGAIPAVGWPAMKMAFSAKPALLEGITVGDKVAFDVSVTGNAGEVKAISKR
ncbi:MAG TPA: copper-binding protein [Novosphingobium sp.]|nr:copper-binding protein [Novosphingobium sp.]